MSNKKKRKKRINQKKLAKKIRNKADKDWKENVKFRDRGLCVICLSSKLVNCHHIIPRGIVEYRHDVMNGICLCPLHHKWGTYSAHKHPLWFFVWLEKNKFSQYNYLVEKINEQHDKENDKDKQSD
jgi:hypothetical protein